jgi:alanyl-tRNA synthetase
MLPLIDQACSLTGKTYAAGDYDDRESFAMRVLAEHARSSTMLVSDGVFPSNEGRGYVLRRIIRRAVRYAYLLGTEKLVMPSLVETAVDIMGNAYPEVSKNRDFIVGVLTREEERFRQTLKNGLSILETELSTDRTELPGSTAFLLHDTYGFPLELTEEIAGERNIAVDTAGFDTEMKAQRTRAKAARKGNATDDDRLDTYREIVEQFGITEFLGYTDDATESRLLAVVPNDDGTVELFLDRTPFYAESGGQVGDTGTIRSHGGEADVIDTTFALPGLRRHTARLTSGTLQAGIAVTATIDVARRAAIRRNHTGTHVLHWALRTVLGAHVKQAGSLVSPERLRFDFSHYAAVTPEEIEEIERLANREVLANAPVDVHEVPKAEAEKMGAIAFFGDKYGDVVRVLTMTADSVELCGGTHARSLGEIGLFKVLSDSGIAAGVRRIEAVTGMNALAYVRQLEGSIKTAAKLVKAGPNELAEKIERLLEDARRLDKELAEAKRKLAFGGGGTGSAGSATGSGLDELAARARALPFGKVLALKVDVEDGAMLRELAEKLRDKLGDAVVLLGAVSGPKAQLVCTVSKSLTGKFKAGDLIRPIAQHLGGSGGGRPDMAQAGGTEVAKLDEALEKLYALVS